MIEKKLEQVRARVSSAARRAGRDPNAITIVAVSKVKPATDIVAAYRAGQRHFGESYVQEFLGKRTEIPELPGARFHMIGHLQANKTTIASKIFDVIQTIDSVRLARRLNDTQKNMDVFLEVKLSTEEDRPGLVEEEIATLKRYIEDCPHLKLRGLMGMPPWFDEPERARPYFRRLRYLAEQYELTEISMGMSRDFETAIEEGSTLVRLGTVIFGQRFHSR